MGQALAAINLGTLKKFHGQPAAIRGLAGITFYPTLISPQNASLHIGAGHAPDLGALCALVQPSAAAVGVAVKNADATDEALVR